MNEIEATYKKLKRIARKHGAQLDGGNCGMVALAIKEHLKHLNLLVALIVNDDATFEDLVWGEPNIYHVYIVDSTEQRYDSTGKINGDYLADFAENEYKDSNPAEWVFDTPEEMKDEYKIIRNNTDWSYDKLAFLQMLEE
jgi:hypothetical protein